MYLTSSIIFIYLLALFDHDHRDLHLDTHSSVPITLLTTFYIPFRPGCSSDPSRSPYSLLPTKTRDKSGPKWGWQGSPIVYPPYAWAGSSLAITTLLVPTFILLAWRSLFGVSAKESELALVLGHLRIRHAALLSHLSPPIELLLKTRDWLLRANVGIHCIPLWGYPTLPSLGSLISHLSSRISRLPLLSHCLSESSFICNLQPTKPLKPLKPRVALKAARTS